MVQFWRIHNIARGCTVVGGATARATGKKLGRKISGGVWSGDGGGGGGSGGSLLISSKLMIACNMTEH